MKIKDEGYTITDVPGLEYAKIVPTADGRIVIQTKDPAMGHERAWDVEQMGKYLTALGRACALAETMQAQNERSES